MAALLAAARAAARGRFDVLVGGCHERDPLRPAWEPLRGLPLASRLYLVHAEEDRAAFDALDARAPYLEAGTLA